MPVTNNDLKRDNLMDYFGINTFNDTLMREKLPKETYKSLQNTIKNGAKLDKEVADTVAHAMKEWALENGITHFTHWFQPMTGLTAEKHDAFLDINGDGEPIQRFSGNMLIQGEPDASSFPSGGMRTTFEARGYTMWDPSSPAFIMEGPGGGILCIPSVFISYNGEALDKKTPLLRSMSVLDKAACDTLKIFGREVTKVTTTLGPEQEYFLVDSDYYDSRPDLILAGRTLIGAQPPKGQEMEDHYFGSIKERVLEFMQLAEKELYKLGIPAKTRHNEVAPHQFELAPIFSEANISADRNQQVMEILKKVATRLDLALLLHEKPFAGVNGSGKHLNWSMTDSDGHNLLDPGHTPSENVQFLVFLVAILDAVYSYSDILRATIASTGNDHRLGANEAPPAIMSVFLGSTLSNILDSIEKGDEHVSREKIIDMGISNLPRILQDNTDRNRTSPFAFTGNKFEFRALGSTASISMPATVLNAAVAESLNSIIEEINSEKKAGKDTTDACFAALKKYIAKTKAIRYEGNNYSDEWVVEAEKRGLPNLKDTPASLEAYRFDKNIKMLTSMGILSEAEIESRYNTKLERYCNIIAIEYETLKTIVSTMVTPSALAYQNNVISAVKGLNEVSSLLGDASVIDEQAKLLTEVAGQVAGLSKTSALLNELTEKAEALDSEKEKAAFIAGKVIPAMDAVRAHSDALEELVPDDLWPLPKYREMLFIM
ncbi:MAG: glutamine synthetase type III [Calditrichaeota bacterium]|nr:MAG: glutamine synthetase type III [Calditrichota bacterium]MBL1205935.1 glutamine synthetase type III [Calditrichota bacterium]NOG45763.1 glutamine synthetase type III [Calditrichota bacterium]